MQRSTDESARAGRGRLPRPVRVRLLALAIACLVGTLGATAADAAVDQLVGRFNGFYDLFVGGVGTNALSATIRVEKPTDEARVRRAFLFAASVPGQLIPDDVVSVEGTRVFWDFNIVATPSGGGGAVNNVAVDVTDRVRARIDAAPAGNVFIRVSEGVQSASIEGTVLAVVFDRPDLTEPRTVVLMLGHQTEAGDQLVVPVAAPLSLLAPGSLAELGVGIASSCQSPACPPGDERTELRLGGVLLSSSAGGEDDGLPLATPGSLLTVGGAGDSPANPDPTATPGGDRRTDDERYDLTGFLNEGDTQVVVDSVNPSGDDNLFFAAFIGTTQPFAVNDFVDDPDQDIGDGVCATSASTCTLRAAIQEAAASGARTVLVPAGDYDLGGTALFVNGDVTIVGLVPNAGDVVRIDASGDDRVFLIDPDPGPVSVDLFDLLVTGGDGLGSPGGGLFISGGSGVTLTRCTVEDNRGSDGGAIENGGSLTLNESTVTGNTAEGNSGIPGDGGGIRSGPNCPAADLRLDRLAEHRHRVGRRRLQLRPRPDRTLRLRRERLHRRRRRDLPGARARPGVRRLADELHQQHLRRERWRHPRDLIGPGRHGCDLRRQRGERRRRTGHRGGPGRRRCRHVDPGLDVRAQPRRRQPRCPGSDRAAASGTRPPSSSTTPCSTPIPRRAAAAAC